MSFRHAHKVAPEGDGERVVQRLTSKVHMGAVLAEEVTRCAHTGQEPAPRVGTMGGVWKPLAVAYTVVPREA